MAKKGFSNMVNSIQEENTKVKTDVAEATDVKQPKKTKKAKTIEHVEEVAEEPKEEKKIKSRFGLKKKDDSKTTEVLSVKLVEKVADAFTAESTVTKKSASAIATELLESVFDAETNTFKVDVKVKEKEQSKTTTLNLPVDIKKALADNAKAHNMKAYEYLNELMLALLEE